MSWLWVTKITPVLYRGDPPNHHAASVSQLIDKLPVVWDMKWNFRSIGWAANHVNETADGRLELLSRLQFNDWPHANETRSSWVMKQLSQWGYDTQDLQVKLTNRALLDANYSLREIESCIFLVDHSESNQMPWMRILGKVNKNRLMLAFHLEDRMLAERSIPIRSHSLISSEISPHGYMPRLRIGQRWSTYQINPLRPPTSSPGMIVATVERYDPMVWNGRLVETLLVVYRKDEGSGSRAAEQYLGRLWVRPDNGMVIKQEIMLLGSRLTLQRREDPEAKQMAKELLKGWSVPDTLPNATLHRKSRLPKEEKPQVQTP